MNIDKAIKDAENAYRAYLDGDPLMVRKTMSLRDVAYRKSSPDKEVWHAELSFDRDFCFAFLAGAAVAAIVGVAVCRGAKRLSRRLCMKH